MAAVTKRIGRVEKNPLRPGMKFNRLRVMKVDGPRKIFCKCDCGKRIVTTKYGLQRKTTKSCGCYNIEVATKRIVAQTTTHGASNTHEYRHWYQMLRRCLDRVFPSYKFYGARGIKVHKAWQGPKGFARFLAHVGLAPSMLHSIDRFPNNTGDYKPGNVRWATPTEQARNRKSNRMLTAFGKTQCLAAWAEEMHMKIGTIAMRLHKGWSDQDAVAQPVRLGGRRPK